MGKLFLRFQYFMYLLIVKSFTTSNTERQLSCQMFSNENIRNKPWWFQISKIVSQKNHFSILIYILSWKHLFDICFRLLRRNNKLKINNFLTNMWRNNWGFNIWCRKRTPLMLSSGELFKRRYSYLVWLDVKA